MVKRGLGSWAVTIAALAIASAGCANVLSLGDYNDAPAGPGDAGTPGADGATAADGASNTDGGTGGCATASAACIPAGWSLVAFADSPQTTCPAGFGASPVDLVGGVSAEGEACTCTCSVTTQPSCVTGPIGITYDINGSKTCATPFQSLANANPGGCNTDNFHGQITDGYDIKLTAPGPTGGACTGTVTKDDGSLTIGEHGRECGLDGACPGGTCAQSITAPFMACIAHDGDVACPAGAFPVAHHLGTDAAFDCPATCSCSLTATCTNGAVTYYGDPQCGGPAPLVNQANGNCASQGGKNQTYGSYKYTATTNASCAPGAAPTGSVTLAGERTMCCAQ
jgi:hypothetical protein